MTTVKTDKAVYLERVSEARAAYESKTADAKVRLEATLRKVAADMKADGYTDVDIAEVTGVSKSHVGRMVAAQAASKVGADPRKVEQALAQSKVTIGEIRKVSGYEKADAVKRFAKMGLGKDSGAKRGGNPDGKRTGEAIVSDLVGEVLARVQSGKCDAAHALRVLKEATARVNRVVAAEAAKADME